MLNIFGKYNSFAFRPIRRHGVPSQTAAETFNQGHRLSSGFLMLRGSSAHSINDRPSSELI